MNFLSQRAQVLLGILDQTRKEGYPPFPVPFSWLGLPFVFLSWLLSLLKQPRLTFMKLFVGGRVTSCTYQQREGHPLRIIDVMRVQVL